MVRVFGLKSKRALVVLIILILLSAGLFPMLPSAGEADNETMSGGSRGARATQKFISGFSTQSLDTSTTYSSVWVSDNGTLKLDKSGTYTIKGQLNVTDNGKVIIEKGVLLKVRAVHANCFRFYINGGIIDCKNDISSPNHGASSLVKIHTVLAIEITGGGRITVEGMKGNQAPIDSSIKSYNGGNGEIDLMTDEYIKITDKSELTSKGGVGGQGVSILYRGGDGGNGIIKLQANGTYSTTKQSIYIDQSKLTANGGSGGSAGGGTEGDGGNGGDGNIEIISKSNDKVSIDKSDIITNPGTGGSQSGLGSKGADGYAYVDFDCRKLLVDDYKIDGVNDEQDWFSEEGTNIESNIPKPSIGVKAPGGAYFYMPDFGSNEIDPKPKAGTTIYIYYVLMVTVEDNSGNKLGEADVEAKLGTETKTGKTDGNGLLILLLLAQTVTSSTQRGLQGWTVKASYSGATASQAAVTLPNRFNEITLIITLITVTIDSITFGGKEYPAGDMVVYGVVTVKGSTFGPNTIDSVKIKAGTFIVNADVTDASGSEPKLTKWEYVWDTRTIIDGDKSIEGIEVKFEATGEDVLKKSDTDYINLTLSQYPKAPVVTVTEPVDNLMYKDSVSSTGLTIKGTVEDPNWDSKQLSHSKDVVEVVVYIKRAGSTEPVLTTILTTESALKYDAANHSYTWSTKWPTNARTSGDKFEYPNGEYVIEITAKDNTNDNVNPTGLTSPAITRKVTLRHIQKPVAGISDITAVENAKRISVYSPTGFDTTKIFKFESEKGATDVKILFDLSTSRDPDSSTILFYLDAGDGKIYKWVNNSLIEHEYIYSVGKEKVTKNYKVIIKVKDLDDAESEKLIYDNNEITNLTIIIDFVPEDPPMAGPLSFIVPLPLAQFEVIIMFIILLIIFNIAAAMMIASKNKNISKRRRAREAAIESARQKQQEQDKGKKDDIYSHIQFEEVAPGEKHVAVAGAAGAMALPSDESIAAGTEQLTATTEPEAPQLISVEQPVYESETTLKATPGTTTEALPAPEAPTPALPAATATPAPATTPVAPQPQPAQPQPQLQAQAQAAPAPTSPAPAAPVATAAPVAPP
ncbi:hypothetical protein, partial [[Eubacterium] cellulosolvens]